MTPKNGLKNIFKNINENSLTGIHFYKHPIGEFVKSLDFQNIAIAGDGIFLTLKTNFGYTFTKIKNINYKNNILDKLNYDVLITSNYPKPNLSIYNEILEMFKYVSNKTKNELMINLYYHIKNKKFIIELADQTVSSTSVKYNYSEKYEMSKDYIRYLQIHSHNTMSANFSGVDDKDEKYTSLCFYGVIGKINSQSKFYNVDQKFRIWTGESFTSLCLEDVFDLKIKQNKLTDRQIDKLDNILKNSETKSDSINLENDFNEIFKDII